MWKKYTRWLKKPDIFIGVCFHRIAINTKLGISVSMKYVSIICMIESA